MRSPYDRSANDDDLSNHWPVMDNPAFHDWLDHAVDYFPLHERRHDLSFDDAALDDWTNNVALDDPTLPPARSFVLISNLDAAPNRLMVKRILILKCIASTKLRNGRRRGGHDGGGSGYRGNATHSKCLQKRTQHCGLQGDPRYQATAEHPLNVPVRVRSSTSNSSGSG